MSTASWSWPTCSCPAACRPSCGPPSWRSGRPTRATSGAARRCSCTSSSTTSATSAPTGTCPGSRPSWTATAGDRPGGSDGDHDLPSGVAGLQVADGLGRLAQLVGPVDHRRDLARLDEPPQEPQVVPALLGLEQGEALAHQREQDQRLDQAVQGADPAAVGLAAARDQHPPGGEGPPAVPRRAGTGQLEQQVVPLAAAGGVLPGVVDDVVGADGADHVQVPRAAHAGHLAPSHPASWTAKVPTPPDAPMIRTSWPGRTRPWSRRPWSGETGQGHGRRVLEAMGSRLLGFSQELFDDTAPADPETQA